MRLESITIKNLLSFKDSRFNFSQYNVIVGPNNVGKTNLVRILKALVDSKLMDFSLIQKMKYSDGMKSQIQLTVETTDKETRLIMQALIDKDIEQVDLRAWKNFTIGLSWHLLDTNNFEEPIIIYFQNHVVVFIVADKHYISYYDPFDVLDFEQRLNKLYDLGDIQIRRDIRKGRHMSTRTVDIRKLITDDPARFFSTVEYPSIRGEPIDLNMPKLEPHKIELVEYMDIQPPQKQFSLVQLISKIIQNSFLRSYEMHPTSTELINNLHQLKNRNEVAYNHLQKLFTNIFPDTTIRVEQKDPAKSDAQTIWITERKKTFELINSASGYLEAIYILYTILNHTHCTIFLDEPEVHFHPIKIRHISRMLSSLTKDRGNQITVITHSPKFLDYTLLDPNSQSMLTMVTKVDNKSLVVSPTSSSIKLKPHMFIPDIFFSNAVFLVEGSRDEFVIKAISDKFDGIFNKYEIVIVNCGGFGGIKSYTSLLETYSIKYYGLADKEYKHSDTITVLDDKLENELQKIKIAPFQTGVNQPKKPEIEVYYHYITELLETKEGFEELKQTKLWASIKNVMDGIDRAMTIFEEKYEA